MNSMREIATVLPEYLRERVRLGQERSVNAGGEFVLYWVRTGMRGHENPALDVAILLARQLGVPVLAYQELPLDYPYASDRHFTFILQGAKDLKGQLAQRGIPYAVHVATDGDCPSPLTELAGQAAAVVAEDMPVHSLRQWAERVEQGTAVPFGYVDTACVVPMKVVGRAFERAYAYREATQQLYAERIARSWAELSTDAPPMGLDSLPGPFVDLDSVSMPELLRSCDIDHSVGPVPATIGGSAAGYRRWEQFRDQRLSRYAADRNDALRDGVSRMSPYLHYGMVSPFRLAREAAAIGGKSAEKYLDELLVWRELAYAFCCYRPEHETLEAIPSWARQTLREGEADARPKLLSWERLARGCTGDPLWDAAQKSLLIHGELHNNVRMTWGKALLNWTADAAHALRLLIDLNHRYALDGNDPASYGGLLWCLGQFDRPFRPARPIFGTVRHRSTEQHAQRLDVDRYAAQCSRPAVPSPPRVAVVGAGLSGLMCARTLVDHGFPVTVFEKGRGVGGRMATRRGERRAAFDHGAQYFTARHPSFDRYVQSWLQDGLVQRWEGRIRIVGAGTVEPSRKETTRYVGVPGMTAVAKHVADGLDVHLSCRIESLCGEPGGWHLRAADGQQSGRFEYVVFSTPAPQALPFLHASPQLAGVAREAVIEPCWAVMVAWDRHIALPYDAAFVNDSALSWISRNSSKPGRPERPDCWVLHASPAWSRAHLEDDPGEVKACLLREFWRVSGHAPCEPLQAAAQRWRYALPSRPVEDRCLFDAAAGLGACGDWCGGPRVEGAFLSGLAAAGCLLRHTCTA